MRPPGLLGSRLPTAQTQKLGYLWHLASPVCLTQEPTGHAVPSRQGWSWNFMIVPQEQVAGSEPLLRLSPAQLLEQVALTATNLWVGLHQQPSRCIQLCCVSQLQIKPIGTTLNLGSL